MSSNSSLPLLLKQLKLITIYQHLDEVTQQATQEGWGYRDLPGSMSLRLTLFVTIHPKLNAYKC